MLAEAVVWSTKTLPLRHCLEGAIRAKRHLAQIVVIADAGEDDVLPLCGVARRVGETAAMFGDPFFGLGGGAVVDGDLVALGLRDVAPWDSP